MAYEPPRPLPGILDVTLLAGERAARGARPDVVLEVPHGATTSTDFDTLEAALHGPFPPDLRAFFHVNTDVGAPELAVATAEQLVRADPGRTALVLRCRLPRTFIDCNRRLDPGARPAASARGQMTPGLPPWVTDPRDVEHLLARCYAPYRQAVRAVFDEVCGAGGTGLMVHTYAPRSVDVPVDAHIVASLRAAYAPAEVERWPLRAEVDLITTTPEGRTLADAPLAARAQQRFEALGLRVARNEAYALHPSTLAHEMAERHPGRTLCFEVRRDLLVPVFTPFVPLHTDPARVERIARALAEALHATG